MHFLFFLISEIKEVRTTTHRPALAGSQACGAWEHWGGGGQELPPLVLGCTAHVWCAGDGGGDGGSSAQGHSGTCTPPSGVWPGHDDPCVP